MKWIYAILVLIVVAVPIALWGTLTHSGGRTYFSPDSLMLRSQEESPFVWHRLKTHPSKLAQHLIARGYWSKGDCTNERWVLTNHWNVSWKDGQSPFHKELVWRDDNWIEWTNANPELAQWLWPNVLDAIRSNEDYGQYLAAELMRHARMDAVSVDELETMRQQTLSELEQMKASR